MALIRAVLFAGIQWLVAIVIRYREQPSSPKSSKVGIIPAGYMHKYIYQVVVAQQVAGCSLIRSLPLSNPLSAPLSTPLSSSALSLASSVPDTAAVVLTVLKQRTQCLVSPFPFPFI